MFVAGLLRRDAGGGGGMKGCGGGELRDETMNWRPK